MQKVFANLVIVLFGFQFVSSQSQDTFLSKFWPTTCNFFSCKDVLDRCVTFGCFGETGCRSCVEQMTIQFDCKVCANEIFREAQSINGLSHKTIFCDPTIALHRSVCAFYCRGIFKINAMCSIINDIPVCECLSIR